MEAGVVVGYRKGPLQVALGGGVVALPHGQDRQRDVHFGTRGSQGLRRLQGCIGQPELAVPEVGPSKFQVAGGP